MWIKAQGSLQRRLLLLDLMDQAGGPHRTRGHLLATIRTAVYLLRVPGRKATGRAFLRRRPLRSSAKVFNPF